MDMHWVHNQYPLWFTITVIGTLLFAVFAIPIARRSGNPLLVCSIPLVITVALSFAGLARLARGMSLAGAGHRAAAAGSAEALNVVVFGAFAAAIVALSAAFRLKSPQVSSNAVVIASGSWVVSALFLALNLSFIRYVTQPGRRFSPSVVAFSTLSLWTALLFLAFLLVVVSPGFSRSPKPRTASRTQFLVCSVAFIMVGVGLWHVAHRLTRFAMGP